MSESAEKPSSGRAALIVLCASLTFAIGSPIARFARPAHPVFVAFGRVVIAALLLFAFDPAGVVKHTRALSRPVLTRIVACGALLGLHFALFQAGLDATSLPAAISLVSLEPLSVVLCAFLVFGDRPSKREQIGVVVATLGALVVSRGAGTGEHKLAGDLLVVGSVSVFGLYVAAARSIREALPARHAGALINTVAAVVIFLMLPWFGAFSGLSTLPFRAFLAISALAVLPTVVGHTLVQSASRTLPPAIVALVSPGETLGGLALGALLLGAMPAGIELVGATLILAGVLFALFAPSRA